MEIGGKIYGRTILKRLYKLTSNLFIPKRVGKQKHFRGFCGFSLILVVNLTYHKLAATPLEASREPSNSV